MSPQQKQVVEILVNAKNNGILITLQNDSLLISVEKGKDVDQDIIDEIKIRKINIVEFLKSINTTSSGFSAEITSETVTGPVPLSYSQERLWFIDRLQGSRNYHLSGVMRLKGSLNTSALRYALESIVDRHEVLRSVLKEEGEMGVQVLLPSGGWQLDYRDIFFDHNTSYHQYIEEELLRPFDLSKDYMLRAQLLRTGHEEYILIVVMHHIASDGWSLSILVREFVALYSSRVLGRVADLPVLTIQYSDYAIWQRRYLRDEVLDKQLAYWERYLKDAEPLELPTDYTRGGEVGSGRGGMVEMLIDKSLEVRLKSLSLQHGCTLFMTLLSVFKVLLYRYSGQEDISVGTPVANRRQSSVEGLIGFFVNTLVIRSDLSGNPRFIDFLQSIRDNTLECYAHQDAPFEKVVERVVHHRDLGRNPLFQVMFTLQNTPAVPIPDLGGMELAIEPVMQVTAKFDITFDVTEEEEGLRLRVEYSSDLFREETVRRMSSHYVELLGSVVGDVEERVGLLPMLGKEEVEELLYSFNDTQYEYARDKTIIDLFEEQVDLNPDRVAVVDGQRQLSYRELDERSNRLAHYLQKKGVKQESLVPICMSRSLDIVIGIIGILKAGGAYVPLDPAYPSQRLQYMITDTGSSLIVTDSVGLGVLGNRESIEYLCIEAEAKWIDKEPAGRVKTSLGTNNLAYIIYTSGSTGMPKGVVIEHRNVVNLIKSSSYLFDFKPDDIWVVFHSFCFDFSVWEMFGALLFSSRFIIIPDQLSKDPVAFMDLIVREKITILNQTPTAFYVLQEIILRLQIPLHVRYVIFGGEQLIPSKIKAWKKYYPDCLLINMYGITETTVHVTHRNLSNADVESNVSNIGRPIPSLYCYIVDNNLQLCGKGIPGELYIGGEGVARGYLNRDDLTHERFLTDWFGFNPSGMLYKSGDICRWLEDGNIEFLGRRDDQVKIRGYRVELGEIESVLSGHPGVGQCVVLARDDRTTGSKQLTGYIVPEGEFNREDIMEYLSSRLPQYMIPPVWVSVPELPLTNNGKVNKGLLPIPDASLLLEQTYVAPRTHLELRLSGIWKEYLQVERVGIHDNFFELGGHSLLATRMISAMRRELGVELSIRDLFIRPTVAGLSDHWEMLSRDLLPALTSETVTGPVPLSYSQERLWFIDRLQGSRNYHLSGVMRLKGSLNTSALRYALESIVDRHEVLRSVLKEEGEMGVQVLLPSGGWQLDYRDIFFDHNTSYHQYIEEELLRPFDLSKDYMLRAQLLRTGHEEYILIVVMHHIASDGWSLSILVREFVALYSSRVLGRVADLPVLTIQYSDYAIWQRRYLRDEVLDKQLAYWERYLKDAEPLELPTDYTRGGEVGSGRGGMVEMLIDKSLEVRLKSLSLQHGCTLFMTLLSVFKVLLYRYSGQEDISVGTPVANRRQSSVEGLIGFFVNTLVIRSDLSGNPRFIDFLQSIRDNTLECYAHQDAPFEKVVERVVHHRDLGRNPLFQVMFTLQNTPAVPIPDLGGMELAIEPVMQVTAKFDITFDVTEEEEGLRLRVEYSSDLFREETVRRMSSHYVELLGSVVGDVEERVGLLPMLGKEEVEELLYSFNDTQYEYARDKTIIDLFEEQVDLNPDRVAVVDGQRQLSYRELDERSNRLAHYLQKKGVKQESLVPICMSRSLDIVIGIIGILKAGGAYVPLDPAYPSQRLQYMITDTGSSLIVTDSVGLGVLGNRESIEYLCIEAEAKWIDKEPAGRVKTSLGANNLAYIIYTSGSTGMPKGVVMPQKAMMNLLIWHQEQRTSKEGKRVLQFASINFDASFQEIFSAVCFGGDLCLIGEDQRKDMFKLLLHIEDYNINHLYIPFVVLKGLSEAACEENRYPRCLEEIFTAGEQLKLTEDIRIFSEKAGIKLFNYYGPSETHVVTAYEVTKSDYLNRPLPPIGKAINNTICYIVDNNLQLCGKGIPGELYIGGEGVARGYLNRDDLTHERFLTDWFGFNPSGMLYKSGDICRWLEDGNIEFLGRRDDQVKIRGYRVELGEIESVLSGHPGVGQCVVLARDDRTTGSKQLTGYIVPEGEFNREDIMEYLSSRLPQYMIPPVWVSVPELPLTNNGKVNKGLLPIPDASLLLEQTYVAPRTHLELRLSGIWKEYLQVERVGIHDNFFELGGHSLLATRMISAMRRELGVELSIRDLFIRPTVAGLSDHWEMLSRDLLPALTSETVTGPVPLSYSQERLWFIDRLQGSRNYHLSGVMRLKGSLNTSALRYALESIVDRHEVLRSVLKEEGEMGVQVLLPSGGWQLDYRDIFFDHNTSYHQYIEEELLRPFDLSKDYMLRAQLLRTGHEEYILIVVMHHIASDGWSLSILVREFVALYSSRVLGRVADLPVLTIQYSDYAIWQRRYLRDEVLDKQLAYWERYLKDAEPLELPTDYTRGGEVGSGRGGMVEMLIDKSLEVRLKSLSLQHGCTLFMTLLSVFKVLLYRYSGQEDISVGTPVANRRQSSVEGLIGFFVNTLVIRSDLSGNPRFIDFLQSIRDNTLECYAHQDAPFEKVVERVVHHRDLGRNPLFQVMFTLQNTPAVPIPDLGGMELAIEPVMQVTAKFDITFDVTEEEEGLRLRVEYSSDLFREETVRRMSSHYVELLGSVVGDVEERVGLLPMLGKEEVEELLYSFNDTQYEYARDKTIIDLFEEQVDLNPDRVAVVDGQRQLSYRELDERSNRLAHYLQKKGVKQESLVVFLLNRNADYLVNMLAIWKLGACFIPLNPSFPLERNLHVLDQLNYTCILTNQTNEMLENSGWDVGNMVFIRSLVDLVPDQYPTSRIALVRPENLSYIIFTSGSTGVPKGVMVEHRGMLNHLYAKVADFGIDEHSNIAQTSTQVFDVSIWQFVTGLLVGGRTTVLNDEDAWEPARLLSAIQMHGITILESVPAHFSLILDYLSHVGSLPALDSLCYLVMNGEALPVSYSRRWFDYYPSIQMANVYGPTECSDDITHFIFSSCSDSWDAYVPIGKPIGNMHLYVLDELLNPVARGIAGELYASGPGVGRGYLNDEEKTAAFFINNPYSEGRVSYHERLYKTGDLVKWLDDGNLSYIGRRDGQIKIRGNRVESGEVEVVMQEYIGIGQVVVIADDENNSGEKRLVAYIVCKGDKFDRKELQGYLRGKLPEYMIPAVIVEMESLPLTINGKVNRKALPNAEATDLTTDNYEAPRNELETKIAEIWQDILKVEKVGIYDNFFELGGHSLLAMRLQSRLQQNLSINMTIRDLFTHPSIASLIEGRTLFNDTSFTRISEVSLFESYVMSSAQRRLWVLSQFEGGNIAYNMPGVYIFEGNLDKVLLEKSFCSLISRHEILRTVFKENEVGEVRQFIKPVEETGFVMGYMDLRENIGLQSNLPELIQADFIKAFDLSEGSLLRAHLYHLSEGQWVFSYVMHHIISDGWSMGILIRELLLFYNGYVNDDAYNPSALRIQYKDYSAWQQQQLVGGHLEEDKAYWLSRFAGEKIPVLQLPSDRMRPSVKTYRGSTVSRILDKELSVALQRVVQQEGATLFMGLLAAVNILLYRYSGQEDIIIGSPIAGRPHTDLEDQIGFYVNTLALRTQLKGSDSYIDVLRELKEQTLDAYKHQMYPFDELVDALRLPGDLSRSPLFDVMVVLQNAQEDNKSNRSGLEGMTVESFVGINNKVSKYDLTFDFLEIAERIKLSIEYNTDLFEPETIQRLLQHFALLLNDVVTRISIPVRVLDYISNEEKDQLLYKFNDTGTSYSNQDTVISLFQRQVITCPNKIAIRFEEKSLSFEEINQRSNQLARYLIHQYSIKERSIIGIMLDRNEWMIIAILAVLKCNAAYVPLDPSYPNERVNHIRKDSSCDLIINDRELELFHSHNKYDTSNICIAINPKDLMYVMYTSGSTGHPKGVMIEHTGIVNRLEWMWQQYHFTKDDVILQKTSFTFDVSIWEIFLPLCWGAEMILCNKKDVGFPERILNLITKYRVSFLHFVPSMLHTFLADLKDDEKLFELSKSVKAVFASGEALSPEIVQKWYNTLDIPIYNLYGPTEASIDATYFNNTKQNKILIGKPIANMAIYITDSERQLVPIGISGEIGISGVGLARGYINMPELTSEMFMQNPFESYRKMYRTGDIGKWTVDGDIEYLGRIDNQVKVRGFRIEPGEIETNILMQNTVKAACVVSVQDKNGIDEIVAYIVTSEGFHLADLKNHLKKHLADFMLPSRYVQVNSIPLNSNGKINRKALASIVANPINNHLKFEMPSNDVEKIIINVWRKLLAIERIGIQDNFFDLGGNSITLIKMVRQLSNIFNKEINVVVGFQYPNVESLAKYIQDMGGTYNDLAESDMDTMVSIMENTLDTLNK